MTGCCSPSRDGDPSRLVQVPPTPARGAAEGFVSLPGCSTLVGRDDPDHPEEWPVREVELAAYRIARCAVTIADFAEFVG